MENSARQYVELYEQCRETIMSHSCEAMNAVREEAFESFRSGGLPGRKDEEYRYTDIREMMAPDLGLNLNRLEIPVDPYRAFRCDVPNLSTQLYFVVNDTLFGKALPKKELPEGVVVDSFCNRQDIVARYYNSLAAADAITSLNTMLAEDGLLIYVPENIVVEKTIQVVNILRSDVDMMVNRRVLIVAEKGSKVKVLFCDHAADDRQFLTTQVTEILAGEGADIEVYGLEETHQRNALVANTYIKQESRSRVHHSLITLHNGKTRQMTRLTLAGEGAECWLNGAVVADKEQHVDNNTLIDHAVPHCDSHELYKYVLDGNAVGAFAGRVLVRKDAQKTMSEERNQNLLSTKTARMYTQPMLEIYAMM